MSTLTPNYGLHLPENTDSMDDFFTNYESDMTTIDDHLGSGGGATIEEMTQAEYEALPDTKLTDGILRGLKDVKSFLDADILYLGTCYSTSERMVGCWIDGKPLYQKCINFGNLPNNGERSVAHGIANVDKIFIVGGYVTTGTAFYNLEHSTDSNYDWSSRVDGTNATIQTYTDRTNLTAIIVVQYTKTTDVAGSGTWTPSGVNAIHYDTNEQVIGTWIDGKPLYEKTIQTGNMPNNSSMYISTPSDIENLVQYSGFVYNTNSPSNQRPLPFSAGGSNDIRVDMDEGNIRIMDFSDWSGYNGYLTIRYTKTTD